MRGGCDREGDSACLGPSHNLELTDLQLVMIASKEHDDVQ